jgi:hypothetical protein
MPEDPQDPAASSISGIKPDGRHTEGCAVQFDEPHLESFAR